MKRIAEKDNDLKQSGTIKMLQETIFSLYDKFRSYLLTTSIMNHPRSNFPRKEAGAFCAKLVEINDIVVKLSSIGYEEVDNLSEFARSLETSARFYRGRDGVLAFSCFLDSFIKLFSTVLKTHREMTELMQNNAALIKKVKELESVIAEMECTKSFDEVDNVITDMEGISLSKEGSHETPPIQSKKEHYDSSEVNRLNGIMESLLFANEDGLSILECFIGVNYYDQSKALIVMYEGKGTPPRYESVIWQNVSLNSLYSMDENHEWSMFRLNQKEQYLQLMKDFYDMNCISMLNSPDIVAIVPSVFRSSIDEPYESRLLVYTKCRDYTHLGHRNILSSGYIKLSDNREVKITVEENYFSYCTSNNGIGVHRNDNLFGTIGGKVTKDSKEYLITCEHVMSKIQDQQNKLGKLASKNLRLK